ncbi:MAG: hypothetical protein PHG96_04585 [Kiritimatiellae bacterium]|nr:hypothetical protein [Kiritimatiellia bacterium]MDD3544620.1 hypothetical protein [Kiritimatiellia bacterium]MDD4025460.1 hypothetical protein [Kiritimatiellia bacterium]MDD4622326.1 hypothetical protein [Kiritimatiellia bacterium]
MSDPDQKIIEAIEFFEQMLQSMPGDRTSLEFLAVAYEQTGQKEKRRDCLVSLAEALLAEKDYENAQVIAGHLSAFSDYPPAQAAVAKVFEEVQGQILKGQFQKDMEVMGGGAAASTTEGGFEDAGLAVHALSRSASAAEMDLVWMWKEREYLPKEMCMDVLHDLTDRPVTDTPMLISALALLDEQHPEMTEALMESMQRDSEIPAIPVELFDLMPAATKLLPHVFIQVKGAVPFAVMGGEALVALMNPFNQKLQEEIAALAGRPCHFYLSHPRALAPKVEKLMLTA